jgi:hypothetical protein
MCHIISFEMQQPRGIPLGRTHDGRLLSLSLSLSLSHTHTHTQFFIYLCIYIHISNTCIGSDDNPWSYFERFAGGTTTAHGINRVFDDDSGIIRRIFWLACFAGGCFGLFKLQCIYAAMIVIMHVIERALCRLTREEHITRC